MDHFALVCTYFQLFFVGMKAVRKSGEHLWFLMRINCSHLHLLIDLFHSFAHSNKLQYFLWEVHYFMKMTSAEINFQVIMRIQSTSWMTQWIWRQKSTLLTVIIPVLGGSGRVVNSLDFCLASLKSLGYFYFRCVLSSQWKVVTVNLRNLHCQF